MTTGNRDNRTNLVGGRNAFGLIVALVLVQGCTVVPDASPDVQPDLAAIVKVVNDEKRLATLQDGMGGRHSLFSFCLSPLPPFTKQLARDLQRSEKTQERPNHDSEE